MNPLSNSDVGMSLHREYEMRYGRVADATPGRKSVRWTLSSVLSVLLRLVG